MVGMRTPIILLAVVATTACGNSVYSQAKKPQPSKQDDGDSGAGPWVVVKQDLKDFTNKGDRILKDFPSEEAARDYAHKLNQQTDKTDPYRWNYIARKRLKDDPKATGPALEENTRPKGGVITKPDLKTVDPGEMKTGGKAATVAGKTGTGTIGDKKVTITFTGKDGKGKFKMSGELEAEGDWQQEGALVTFDTEVSKYRGVLRGDKLAGVRFIKQPGKDGKNALWEWSVTLKDNPTRAQKGGKKEDLEAAFTGSWKNTETFRVPSGDTVYKVSVYKLNADKTALLYSHGSERERDYSKIEATAMKEPLMKGTWAVRDNGVVVMKLKGYSVEAQYEIKLLDGEIEVTGQYDKKVAKKAK